MIRSPRPLGAALFALALGCTHGASSPDASPPGADAAPSPFALAPMALEPPAAASIPKACQGPEHRAFDFWIGEWEVYSPDGKRAGTNRIEPVLGGCALKETWQTGGPYRGHSFNTFDTVTGQWRQLWLDTGGLVLDIRGGVEEGSMVMTGQAPGPGGAAVTNRITWTPLPGGHVRQHWEGQGEDGAWSTYFDGRYVPRGEAWSPEPAPQSP